MSLKHTLIASSIMIFTAVFLNYISHSEAVHPNKPFSTFPKQIGEWKGIEQRFNEKIYDILGVDDSYLATYRAPDGRQVQLYIGFLSEPARRGFNPLTKKLYDRSRVEHCQLLY